MELLSISYRLSSVDAEAVLTIVDMQPHAACDVHRETSCMRSCYVLSNFVDLFVAFEPLDVHNGSLRQAVAA